MSEGAAFPPKAESRTRVPGIAEGLTVSDIERALDEWRTIGRQAFLEGHGGTPALKYVLVDDTDEIDALALLRGARQLAGLKVAPSYRGDRVNVAEPLRRLGFFVENLASATESPVTPDSANVRRWVERFEGLTDQRATRTVRREQNLLRGAVGIGTGDGGRLHRCGLCARQVPERLGRVSHTRGDVRASIGG